MAENRKIKRLTENGLVEVNFKTTASQVTQEENLLFVTKEEKDRAANAIIKIKRNEDDSSPMTADKDGAIVLDTELKAQPQSANNMANQYVILSDSNKMARKPLSEFAPLVSGKIPASYIPDVLMGQVMYGGTVNKSAVATLSSDAKTRLGTTSNTVTLTNNTSTYGYTVCEGMYFIASEGGTVCGQSLLTGDWLISTGTSWTKIDNTDAVTGVKGENESTYRIGQVNITKANIGLGNVENTADADKNVAHAETADSATKLATARTITLSGDVTGSASFDGTAHKTISTTLKPSGVTAGTYSVVAVNAKGIVTGGNQLVEWGSVGQTTPSNSLAVGGLFLELQGDTSGGTSGGTSGAYCGCCGATSNLIPLGGGDYVCEACYESWG